MPFAICLLHLAVWRATHEAIVQATLDFLDYEQHQAGDDR
jgi:hypothetical protein